MPDKMTAELKEVTRNINKLELQYGFKKVAMERALSLPFGTIDKMLKREKPPRDFVALTRILAMFPWIVKVADEGYTKAEATRQMGKAAMDIIADSMQDKETED